MNIYKVIDEKGKIYEASEYLNQKNCSEDFKILIQREALGDGLESGAEESDYIKVANKLGFNWEPFSDIGFIQMNYKAKLMHSLVAEYAKQLVHKINFPIYEVSGSNFYDMQHPAVESYAALFGDRLFQFKPDKKKFLLSYDASYPQFNLAKSYQLSEKNLPFGHFSISDCYRYEQRGECMLLFRGRRFFMPDFHPYFKSVKDAFKWYSEIEKQLLSSFKDAKREVLNVAKVSSIKNWDKYQDELKKIAMRNKKPMLCDIRNDGEERYWIIDIDYSIIDQLKQVREIGCIQIDIGNAKRLGISFRDKDNKKKNPVIIHSAIPGGIERYLYMIIDNYKNYFPLWINPVQVRIIPVSNDFESKAIDLINKYKGKLRIEIDDRSESVPKRIKRAHEDVVQNIIVFGEKELADMSKVVSKLKSLVKEVNDFPFLPISWPIKLSEQVR